MMDECTHTHAQGVTEDGMGIEDAISGPMLQRRPATDSRKSSTCRLYTLYLIYHVVYILHGDCIC